MTSLVIIALFGLTSCSDIFSRQLPSSWQPQIRCLRLRDPCCVCRYNKLLESYLLQHHLPDALYSLETSIGNHPPTESQQHEANCIYSHVVKGQLMAESKCRKLKMGQVQFLKTLLYPANEFISGSSHFPTDKDGRSIPSVGQEQRKLPASQKQLGASISLLPKPALKKLLYDIKMLVHSSSRLLFIESFNLKHCDQILRAEEQRRKGRLAHQITGKLKGGSVSHIQHTCTHNGIIETYDCET